MLHIFNKSLRRLYSNLRWPVRRRSKSKVVIKRFGKTSSKSYPDQVIVNGSATVHPNGSKSDRPIRIATFNAALFSMADAVPKSEMITTTFECANGGTSRKERERGKPLKDVNNNSRKMLLKDHPKSILKQSPLHSSSMKSSESSTKPQKFAKSKLRVYINLPDNEISLLRSRQLSFREGENDGASSSSSSAIARALRGKSHLRSVSFDKYSERTIVEVLRELDADILALQDVKAEEEKEMSPLSDLASALGMNYVFAESWAPEYGNAILSKWPIKRWKIQKLFDDSDIRNVLKATIDVPEAGEVNFQCTLLDHLDENWRMKQMDALIQSNEEPHILAGGLNSLDEMDYSQERWTDIVKYYEEMGKPPPKCEVMRHLKSKQYTDAKDFAGECEPVVMIAKGQSVQGTCKYGTRVDYIMMSRNSLYKFVPGSYSVVSSKGTSDHHIVKVDVVKMDERCPEVVIKKRRQPRPKVVKITNSSSRRGIWRKPDTTVIL